MIYLDNAATSGQKPIAVVKAVNNALINFNANPGRSGHDSSIKAAEEVYKCRKALKEFFNASNENNVCFTYNCTYAINMVLNGVLKEGDHVIISSLEHNAVARPVNYLNKRKNIQYDVAQVDLINDDLTVKNIEKCIKKNTKLIFVTAASNVVGKKLPLKRIGEICKKNNILFGVDAAQLAGKGKINIQADGIDYLCIAPHKGFYAPTGIGVLIAEKSIDNVLISGGTGVNSVDLFQPDDLPERIESGTQNIPAILGLSAGISFVNSKTVRKIEAHEIILIQHLYKSLKKMGAELYTIFPEQKLFSPVLSFNLKGYSSEKIGEYLNKNNIAVRTGLHCAPFAHKQLKTIEKGTVRVSPSVFNNSDDVERLIFCVKKLI